MRIELTLDHDSNHRFIPMDYQYYVSAWIYNVLRNADNDYATFLHDFGYGKNTNHLYKLFCFSRLHFGKPKMWKEKKLFQILNKQIYLKISFNVNEAATNFIKGLFIDQRFYIGNKLNGIDFFVKEVQILSEPDFSTTETYRTITPWVVSHKEEKDMYAQYLDPGHPLFITYAVNHLAEKHNNLNENQVATSDILLKVSSDYKRSGFLIKPGSKEETRVIGTLCDFTLTAPVVIHKMIWHAGLCEKSSLGFGWIEIK
ncbi:MAG TPA: CRISPR-associated endoribonuclease Cas6 [Bacteroidaceae bacterium]|nr:CRISPR-associated endoribonuclease Cas6 [Bacteroidaceae bacterium]